MAKCFLAVWLRLCEVAGLRPCSKRIDKPLVCLLLHGFGMRPSDSTAGKHGRRRGVQVTTCGQKPDVNLRFEHEYM